MDALTLDFSKYYNDIIEALKEVYGHEYGHIIERRFKNMEIITYANKSGIFHYHAFLESLKTKELCVKFLNQIGIDTSKFNITSYADKFPEELQTLIVGYLDSENAFKWDRFADTFRAFDEEKAKGYSKENIIDAQIEFINFIRNGKEDITKETYEDFKKTGEYVEILNIVKKYNQIFNELVLEMKSYLESIKKYKDYYINEDRRYKKILEDAAISLYSSIGYQLPEGIMNILNNYPTIEEVISKFFGSKIDSKLYIEYFSVVDEMKLKNESTPKYDKDKILLYRMMYFKNMGIDIDPLGDNYYEIIKREDVKRIIPPQDIVGKLTEEKNMQLKMVNYRFVCENENFVKCLNYYGNSDNNRDMLYEIIGRQKVCNLGGSSTKDSFVSFVFLTMREYQCGIMDYIAIHEIIHAIESQELFNTRIKGDYRCGFESPMFDSKLSIHPHRRTYRKYERLNENITDMFALEVRSVLHKKGIYIMEPKEHTKTNEGNHNTSKITKEMLTPFLERYRKLIVGARISGTLDRLKECIGVDNFEKLNDIIDYVDVLCERGLEEKINKGLVDDLIYREYAMQLRRLEAVYASMEECYILSKQRDINSIEINRNNTFKRIATDDIYNDYKGRFY